MEEGRYGNRAVKRKPGKKILEGDEWAVIPQLDTALSRVEGQGNAATTPSSLHPLAPPYGYCPMAVLRSPWYHWYHS